MKTYRVYYKTTDYVYADIEANSIEEAKDIAAEMDGGEFILDADGGGWDYDRTVDYETRKVVD